MNYKEIREKLVNAGFVLEYEERSSLYMFPVLCYANPLYKGFINISFEENNSLGHTEFPYENGWTDELEICNVSISIDISLSYMSSDVIDISNEIIENVITLLDHDIDLYFDKVLNIITNPYFLLSFDDNYNIHLTEFKGKVKRFIYLAKKYNFQTRLFPLSGNSTTLYRSLSIAFMNKGSNVVDFIFVPLSWKCYILVNNIFVKENIIFDLDCELEELEEAIKIYLNQIEELDNYRNLNKLN